MTENTQHVNPAGAGSSVPGSQAPGIATLQNVAAFSELVLCTKNRGINLPGIGVMYGKSGYGKSFSAAYAAVRYNAVYVEVHSIWTRKRLCQAILHGLGIPQQGSGKTLPEMVDVISAELAMSDRPLIIDEADFLVAKNMIEIVRDIFESTQGAVILIGEEGLPGTLKHYDRYINQQGTTRRTGTSGRSKEGRPP